MRPTRTTAASARPARPASLQEAGGDEHLEERQGEDQVPAFEEDARLRPGDHERERRDEQHRGGQQHRGGARAEEDDSAEHGERGDDGGCRGPAGAEVADRVPDVLEDVDRRSQLRVALAGEADAEARREHAVDEPERRDEHDDDPKRDRGRPERQLAPPTARQDVDGLCGEHEGPVRLRRDGEHHRRDPRGPALGVTRADGTEKREERKRAEEEEEAVHARVDAVVDGDPARRGERGGDERGALVREPGDEGRDHGHARDREDDRHEPQRGQAGGDRAGEVGEEPVERRAAALGEDGGEDIADRLLRDEEDESLVLVRRPHRHLEEEEGGERSRDDAHPEVVRVFAHPENRALQPGLARRPLGARAGGGRPPW